MKVPKVLFLDAKFVDEIADIMKKETAPTLKRLFRQTTYGWTNHPSWKQHLAYRKDEISMEVWTDDSKYGLINAGSPKHSIDTKFFRYPMRFRKGYRASTHPGQLQSRKAYRSAPWWTARHVDHPGFDPRKFDELVAETYSPSFRKDVQQAIDNAAKRVLGG